MQRIFNAFHHRVERLPRVLYASLFLLALIMGVLLVSNVASAGVPIGGTISYYELNPLLPTFQMHTIVGFAPGIGYCGGCLGPAGIGQWFLGELMGTVIVGLPGLL